MDQIKRFRDYEVSIWTLQDGFITVLKPSNLEAKGRIEDPKMELKDDKENTFSFKLPMHLLKNNVMIENPLWCNTTNGVLVANMRKIKVIFNKKTDIEEVFEFLITKVTESHNKFETYCEVECEELAFNELGKTGYKIDLSADLYNIEYGDALDNDEDPPVNNINYWIEKVLDGTRWSYEICMDWNGVNNLLPTTVYEDAYVSNWIVNTNNNVTTLYPQDTINSREKLRIVEGNNSNRYNLLQSIAETFGVFCDFIYEYDETYHIRKKKVIFYNNYFRKKKDNFYSGKMLTLFDEPDVIDLTYHYDTDDISREMDGSDLVTKMFVTSSDSTTTNSITEATANKMLEDYLLNFDYLYNTGAITEEQYAEVKIYEAKMRDYNEKIQNLQNKLNEYKNSLYYDKSILETVKQSVILDQEQLSNAKDQIAHLLNTQSDKDSNPTTLTIEKEPVVIVDGVINLPSRHYGILTDGIEVTGNNDIILPITKINVDEHGFAVSIEVDSDSNLVSVTYNYSPELYYKTLVEIWTKKLSNDREKQEQYQALVDELDGARDENGKLISEDEPGLIIETIEQMSQLLSEKQKIINDFENLMGPALREGTWQPEDNYSKYGERHNNNYTLTFLQSFIKTKNDSFIFWDSNVFDSEEKGYELVSVNLERDDDYFIDLTNDINSISDLIQSEDATIDSNKATLSNLSVYVKRITSSITQNELEKYYPLNGAVAHYSFVKFNDQIRFGILLKGSIVSDFPEAGLSIPPTKEEVLNYLKENGKIGYVDVIVSTEEVIGNQGQSENTSTYTVGFKPVINSLSNKIQILQENSREVVYPRIRINSTKLKLDNYTLILKLINEGEDSISLREYYDYYITTRNADKEKYGLKNENPYNYYITIRPEVLAKNYNQFSKKFTFNLNYEIDNTALMIYLDAVQVMKENSMPKVSYEITPKMVKKNILLNLYQRMHQLAHINDYELKFKDVMGYISEITLSLDSPKDDKITIKNYKTKFEDLFSSIVAQTEQMKKNSYTMGAVSNAFSTNGIIDTNVLERSIENLAGSALEIAKIGLKFSNPYGIYSETDEGIISFNKTGIFTATEKDSNGDWKWNTSILPSGINASAITTGRLDTSLVRIFSGDNLRLQLNGDGLFAYDAKEDNTPDMDTYVVHNRDGIFFHKNDIDLIELSWNGLIARDNNNEEILKAADGNLILKGEITANTGKIGPWCITSDALYTDKDYDPDNPSPKGIGTAGEMYLGKDGFSIGRNFQIERNEDGRLENFIIRAEDDTSDESNDTDDDNFLLKITARSSEQEEQNEKIKYILEINPNSFDTSSLVGRVGGYGNIYYANAENGEKLPELVPDGSLGIIYLPPQSPVVVGDLTGKYSEKGKYISKAGPYAEDNNNRQSILILNSKEYGIEKAPNYYFWNVNKLPHDDMYKNYDSFVRAGCLSNTKSYSFASIPISFSNNAQITVPKLFLNFTYCIKALKTDNASSDPRLACILVEREESNNIIINEDIIAEYHNQNGGNYWRPEKTDDVTEVIGTEIELYPVGNSENITINIDKSYFIVFYCLENNSLMFIKTEYALITTEGSAPQQDESESSLQGASLQSSTQRTAWLQVFTKGKWNSFDFTTDPPSSALPD